MPERFKPRTTAEMLEALKGLSERSLARQAAMPKTATMPLPSEEGLVGLPRSPVATNPKNDRRLTTGERNLYKQYRGVWPDDNMMLSEFRRYMGSLRKRGGME